jgi:[NiFe] hydrogenase diaphorase moiety large subunit
MKRVVQSILKRYAFDQTRLLDIFWGIQNHFGYISQETLEFMAPKLDLCVAQLKDTLSFYHFFHDKPAGKMKIYVDTSAISEIFGLKEVIACFEKELSCKLGSVSQGCEFGLYETSCIGMSDQAPAAIIQGVPVGKLTPRKIKSIVRNLKLGILPKLNIVNKCFSANPFLTETFIPGQSLETLFALTSEEVISEVTLAGIRGRGGAGFLTGKKWELCAGQKEKTRYVVCNADEGEPGTFKDRFLLTQFPQLVFEGMIVAAFAIKSEKGFLYLRAEYKYLLESLEEVLTSMRAMGLLGKNIQGIKGFHFDIRIQLGAGAYVVGEETALLESLEGRRGEPRVRPPFPVEEGYLGKPTIVNNVETFASVAKIMKYGLEDYRSFGTADSPGTKLLSVSGDCGSPGVYEVQWGITVKELFKLVQAKNPKMIQVGGASGICLNASDDHRVLGFEDLPTGGSIMIFNKDRDILKVIKNFVQFFVNESCGCCTPCRAGNIVLNEQMDSILKEEAAKIDLERIKDWSKVISSSSRCGLGQTCTNPMTSSMEAFPELYAEKVLEHEPMFRPFNVSEETSEYNKVVKSYE